MSNTLINNAPSVQESAFIRYHGNGILIAFELKSIQECMVFRSKIGKYPDRPRLRHVRNNNLSDTGH